MIAHHLAALAPSVPVRVDVPPAGPSEEFLALIPQEFARRHLILSEGTAPTLHRSSEPDGGVQAGSSGITERLIIAPTTRVAAIFNVGVRLGHAVTTRVGDAESIAAAIDAAYGAFRRRSEVSSSEHLRCERSADAPSVTVEGSDDVAGDMAAAVRAAESDLLSTSGKSPVVRLVDLILFEALRRGASDVHIQPVGREGTSNAASEIGSERVSGLAGMGHRTLIRYRLDGSLHTVRDLPGSLASAVVSRIKVMARLDVAERRAPQDGRASVSVGGVGTTSGRQVDLRVSTLPSTYGERVVLRLLDPSRSPHLLSFTALGMPPELERRYLAQANRASGIVLSTGPTGSGKTTTLYATLAWLSSQHDARRTSSGCELNMMTVEDPVEYDLSTIGALLRNTGGRGAAGRGAISQTQVDPKKNVTFATGLRHILRQDPDVIMVGEIRDEETARMAVQASLTGHLVLSTLHTNDAAGAVARLLDLDIEPFLVASSLSAVLAQRLVRRLHESCSGRGCHECFDTGFRGRLGVFELLVIGSGIRALINQRATADRIKALAESEGMVSLRAAGEAMARCGLSTLTEIGRVIDLLDDGETAR